MTRPGDVLREPRQRERPVGKMYYEQPSAQHVDQVVQAVRIGDSVDGREQRQREDQ